MYPFVDHCVVVLYTNGDACLYIGIKNIGGALKADSSKLLLKDVKDVSTGAGKITLIQNNGDAWVWKNKNSPALPTPSSLAQSAPEFLAHQVRQAVTGAYVTTNGDLYASDKSDHFAKVCGGAKSVLTPFSQNVIVNGVPSTETYLCSYALMQNGTVVLWKNQGGGYQVSTVFSGSAKSIDMSPNASTFSLISNDEQLFVWGDLDKPTDQTVVVPNPTKYADHVVQASVSRYAVSYVTSSGELYAFGLTSSGYNASPVLIARNVRSCYCYFSIYYLDNSGVLRYLYRPDSPVSTAPVLCQNVSDYCVFIPNSYFVTSDGRVSGYVGGSTCFLQT